MTSTLTDYYEHKYDVAFAELCTMHEMIGARRYHLTAIADLFKELDEMTRPTKRDLEHTLDSLRYHTEWVEQINDMSVEEYRKRNG